MLHRETSSLVINYISERVHIKLTPYVIEQSMAQVDKWLSKGSLFTQRIFGVQFMMKMRENGLNEQQVNNALTCKQRFINMIYIYIYNFQIKKYFYPILFLTIRYSFI